MKENRAIRYLSMATKAGKLIVGAEECEKAVKKGKGGLLVVASDAAPNADRLAAALAASKRVRLMKSFYTKSEIAAAVGRGSAVALALVTDGGLAEAFASAAVNGMEQEERI